jgi:hypothetical protein
MSELSTSAHFRLRSVIGKRLKESMADTLATTIDDLENKLVDARAQDLIDELIVILQGRAAASDRLQDGINFCLSIADEYEDEENSGVVDTSPKTNDKQKE